jgi:hypothetical protein
LSSGVELPAPPAWFRLVVWDSLVGGLCPLLPVPILDDLALRRVRRHLVQRLCQAAGVAPTAYQVTLLAGGRRGLTVGGCAAKAVLYPLKKIYRKVLYFLAIKEAVDTFSLLFHQGYLLQVALDRGALGRQGTPSDGAAHATGLAILNTLEAADTRPINRMIRGVLVGSLGLVAASVRFMASRFRRRTPLEQLAAKGADPERLAAASPATEALLDRLLALLWGEERYRQRLEDELVARLWPPPPPLSGEQQPEVGGVEQQQP